MTEAEWLACDDPRSLVDAALASPRASDRVCRLYVAAFWGWQALRLRDDGPRADLLGRVSATEHWAETGRLPKGFRKSRSINIVFHNSRAPRAVRFTIEAPFGWARGALADEAIEVQPHLLREIFGNPFRPIAVDPSWLTSDVLALARGIYEEKAFDRMPILADALQDAGCASEDVLTHCRDANQAHVRGCWVLDLVLGK